MSSDKEIYDEAEEEESIYDENSDIIDETKLKPDYDDRYTPRRSKN